MISYLRGNVARKNFGNIVLDVKGVGYSINVTLDVYVNLPDSGEIMIYIFHHIWQDGQELYGFLSEDERAVFKVMTGVSGVGPKLACRILQNVDYQDFVAKISNGDTAALVKINGLGKKTAEKFVFELKDKFNEKFSALIPGDKVSTGTAVNTAIQALVSLGYKENHAGKVIKEIYEKDKNISVEELVKKGLAYIYEK